MAKRRTRKQKINAKPQFTISWGAEAKSRSAGKAVKREKFAKGKGKVGKSQITENTVSLVKDASLGTIKRDILKTLIITSFILGTEMVIYWAWL